MRRTILTCLTAMLVTTDVLRAEEAATYTEALRPQFHFTAVRNWLNDPNGLVFHAGEYHLFFQHNPKGNEWGNMTWGHAVSTDLVRWKQLEHALLPDTMGTMFSGSAVVDWNNTAGFRTGSDPALVAIYTAAGDTSPESKGKPFTQCIAYSNDKGRTWTKYTQNPVLANVSPGNRGPKVIWHEGTRRWVMALYKERSDFALFSSPDLKTWMHLQDLTIPGSDECPDFFSMPLDGDARETRWVLLTANGRYVVGTFDGHRFTPESGPHPSDYGANYYAVQSFSDTPDGRRITIAWMRGGQYPGMPFNQQMTFPCEAVLTSTPVGPRMVRAPVKEIASLHGEDRRLGRVTIGPGGKLLDDWADGCFDLGVEVEGGTQGMIFAVYGHPLVFDAQKGEVTFLGRPMPAMADGEGDVTLRLLVDRTSLEVFAGNGAAVMSSCFVPTDGAKPIVISAKGDAAATLTKVEIRGVKSAWARQE